MLRKIKNYLLHQKLVVILLCFFIVLGLFYPFQKAKADLFGVMDAFSQVFEGVEEESGPLAKYVIMVFVIYIIGLVMLYTSAHLLNLVITQSPNWLIIQNSALVKAGWGFISGLANLFLILIFLVIAIAYILKLETFQAKKALPRLIIVALLINFSLVFIGALVDISTILYNTVLKGNENVVLQFIDALGVGGWNVVWQLMLWLILLVTLWAIPIAGGFSQLAFVILVLGFFFLPNIVTWIFQIVSFFMISGLFFTYTFLFATRIFLIQLLAILAPLAFVCLILPQTKKWWDEWLKHLLEWTFFGIVLLFFLAIGLRAANELVPPTGLTPISFLGWINIAGYFVYYFFIFIYLILLLWVSQKFMPIIAGFIIAQATTWGQRAYESGVKPFGRVLKESGRKAVLESPRVQRWAESQAMAGKRWGPFPGGLRRLTGRALGPGLREAEKKDLAKYESEAEKIKDPTLMFSKFRSAMETRDFTTALAFYNQAIKKGGGFKKEFEKVDNDDAKTLGQYANRVKAAPEAERVGRSKANVADQMGFEPLKPEDIAKGYKTIQDKLIGEAKGDEIKEFAKGFWKTPESMEATQRFWGGPQLGKAADEFGREFVESYMEEADKKKAAWYLRNNQRALLYLSGNAAQDLGFRSVEGLTRAESRELIERWKARKRLPSGQKTLDEFTK